MDLVTHMAAAFQKALDAGKTPSHWKLSKKDHLVDLWLEIYSVTGSSTAATRAMGLDIRFDAAGPFGLVDQQNHVYDFPGYVPGVKAPA